MQKEKDDLIGITDLSKYKANNLVKVKVEGVKGYGTIWGNNAKNGSAARSIAANRSALDVQGSETLVGFDKDGNAFEALTLPEGLADWCEFQPVREVYQCPETTVEDEAKGVYVVFSWYIDWWKDKEGNDVAPIGQIFYIRPDGTVFDILGADGNVHKTLITYLKENDDVDYIKFDENGNIYMLVEDRDDSNKPYIVRYNPLNDKVDYYSIKGTDLLIRNFELTKDGKYIFLNVMTNYKEVTKDHWEGNNYVYAIPVNSDAEPVALYEPAEGDKSWGVSNFTYDTINSALYFYANAYNNNYVGSGLYVCKKDADGAFTKDGVTNYFVPAGWMFTDVYKACEKSDGTYNAKKLLNYLKSFYGRNSKKVYFTLDFFSQYKDAVSCNESDIIPNKGLDFDFAHSIGGWFWPYNELYATEGMYNDGELILAEFYETDGEGKLKDEMKTKPHETAEAKEGKVLTEEKAMNYLLNYIISYPEDGVYKKANIWERFFMGAFTTWAMDGAKFDCVPMYLFFTTDETGKWSKETAAFPGDYNMSLNLDNAKAYSLSKWPSATGGIIISNNEGVWLLQDCETEDLDNEVWEPDYSYVIQVANEAGKITMTQPDGLKDVKGYPSNHDWNDRQEDDPWYKTPLKTTSKGFALTGADKHSIYYYDVAKQTCTKVYDNKKLATIYSFSLSKDSVVYNGVTLGGGNRTGSIELASKKESEIDTQAQLQTITVVDIPEVDQKEDPIEE